MRPKSPTTWRPSSPGLHRCELRGLGPKAGAVAAVGAGFGRAVLTRAVGAQTSQSTLLLKKRKKMREMDDALERKKEEYNAKMQAFAERQRKFEQAQTKLREQVAELAPFLQENDAKRAKALKRAKDEEEARASAESKLERMRASLQEMQDQKRELEHRLQRLRRYEDFLQRVVDSHSADSYGEIADVLNRHRTLDTAYSVRATPPPPHRQGHARRRCRIYPPRTPG